MKNALFIEDEPLLCSVYQHIFSTLSKEKKIPQFSTRICKNYEDALKAIHELSKHKTPLDFCLLDHRLGEENENENGLSLGLSIIKEFPLCKILVITSVTDNYVMHSILENLKPLGFLIKSDISLDSIKRDLCAVIEGETVYSKKVTDYIKDTANGNAILDERDLKLIHLLDQGYTLPEIGNKIGLSLSGIEYRKRRIAHNIGASSSSIKDVLDSAKNERRII